MNRLRRYGFKDDHGHPLENCKEYIEIHDTISRLTRELERERIHVISLRDALRRANGLLDEVDDELDRDVAEAFAVLAGQNHPTSKCIHRVVDILSKRKAGA